jgi:dolichol-phosphate mannosyltransferase/undecaprenyl-phosphate 4-deoxy-4-formamido-L-arabinose transferase
VSSRATVGRRTPPRASASETVPPDENCDYSVVIPAYNCAASINELVQRIANTFTKRVRASYEIVIVDDGSPNPDTWPTIVNTVRRHRHVRAFRLTRNFGRVSAVLCGMERARGRWIITMDDDLQHRPEDIVALVGKQEHDAVIADFGFSARRHSWTQKTTSFIRGWFEHLLLGIPRHLKMSPYMMIRSDIVRMMLESRSPHPFIPALLFHATTDVVAVSAVHEYRRYGKSAFNFWRRMTLFSNLLINNSSFLLKSVAVVGIIAAAMSVLLATVLTVKRLNESIVVEGWTSLAVIELFFGGLILFSLGVIGEYLLRITQLAERRPAYFVRSAIDSETAATAADQENAARRGRRVERLRGRG